MPNMVALSKVLSSLIPAASDYPQQRQLPLIHSNDCCSLVCGVGICGERIRVFFFSLENQFMILLKA